MRYFKYFIRFLLIAGLIVFTVTGTYSGIVNNKEDKTNVVVTDKYANQYHGTITNYIEVCRKSDNLCTTLSVRDLDTYNIGSEYTFVLSNAKFMWDWHILYWAVSFSIFLTFLICLIGYFIIWCFKD